MEAVIILKSQLAKLLRESEKLRRLEWGGVDNWDWYGESLNDKDDDGLTYDDIQDMSDKDLIESYGYKIVEIS